MSWSEFTSKTVKTSPRPLRWEEVIRDPSRWILIKVEGIKRGTASGLTLDRTHKIIIFYELMMICIKTHILIIFFNPQNVLNSSPQWLYQKPRYTLISTAHALTQIVLLRSLWAGKSCPIISQLIKPSTESNCDTRPSREIGSRLMILQGLQLRGPGWMEGSIKPWYLKFETGLFYSSLLTTSTSTSFKLDQLFASLKHMFIVTMTTNLP